MKNHFKNMVRVYHLHGLKAVIGIELSKIPGALALYERLVGRYLVKTKILGSTMFLDVRDRGLHRKLLLKGIREIEHTDQIKRNIRSGMIGVELGANIGYFGLLEAQIVGPEGHIYCIEPAPRNLRLLMRHVEANGFWDRMSVYRYLIGDHNGTEKLYLSEFGNVHGLSPKGKKGFIETPMITLDAFMDNNELKPKDIDFLRMDIEGYEVMAFQGMQKLLAAGTPLKIFMEFHPMYYDEWGWTFEKLLRYLDSHRINVREIAWSRENKIMHDPTIEEMTAFQNKTADAAQAFLEREPII